MQENEKKSWDSVENLLASEIIAGKERLSHAKDIVIIGLFIAVISITIVMAALNYMNDRDWRKLFASYDYVSQDGEGYNYYNSDIGGDVNNGTESTETEGQKES